MTESGLDLRYKINPSLEIRCPIPRPWNKGSNKTGHLTWKENEVAGFVVFSH